MPKTLLLADDSVVIQKLVGLSFANEDVELVTTDNGDDALTRAREISPDLVLADVVMPGKNGYEVCLAIKEDPQLCTTPVLLLTGTFEAFDEDRARQVGADGHITKPFEAQGLVDRVTDLLSRPRPEPVAAPAPVAPAAAAPAFEVAAAPVADGDDAYDFFDDEVQELAAPAAAPPAPAPAAAAHDSFEFGTDLDPLSDMSPGGDRSETLDTNFELDSDPPNDLTVAVMAEAPPISPPPVPVDLGEPDATQIAMGETMITDDFGALQSPPPVTSLDSALEEPAPLASSAATAEPIEPAPIATPDPAETMLADDLFADPAPTASPQSAPPPIPIETPTPARAPAATASDMPPAMDSGFEFGFDDAAPAAAADPVAPIAPNALGTVGEDITAPDPAPMSSDLSLDTDADPLAGLSPEPALDTFGGEPHAEAPALADAAESTHSGYDVSVSDLGSPLDDPLASSGSGLAATDIPEAAPAPPPIPSTEARTAPITSPSPAMPELGTSSPPDLSPMMQDRIHETLEKVAWEAFADVSDTIVRQVLQRVESIVWEVVPQMAEALIQEEIRRMKGEE
jgi:CheY-like chemotaxis protein